jgi:hypothetical protein
MYCYVTIKSQIFNIFNNIKDILFVKIFENEKQNDITYNEMEKYGLTF